MIHVVVPSYNCMTWLPQCLESVRRQDIDCQIMVVDDGSTDPLQRQYITDWAISNNAKYLTSGVNRGAMHSIYWGIALSRPRPHDVVVIVDGDDWFPHDACLRRIAAEYEDPDCWMTYGSYVPLQEPFGGSLAEPYPEHVVKNRLFRSWPSVFNHPISFKAFLWNALDVQDLQRSDGSFYMYLYDHAMMYPMLEMAGDHFRFIPDSLYVYNNTNALSDERRNLDAERDGTDILNSNPKRAMRLEGNLLLPLEH